MDNPNKAGEKLVLQKIVTVFFGTAWRHKAS